MRTITLLENQVLWIGRHGNCMPAEIDSERTLSQQGISDTKKVSQKLKATGFGMIPKRDLGFAKHMRVAEISSPARRVLQTSELLSLGTSMPFVYDDLYNFEQFPRVEELYQNKVTDPNAYLNANKREVFSFQERLAKKLEDNGFMNIQFISIISHAIISNFIAMMFTDDQIVFNTMLPESAGFLITKDHCQLITA